MFMNSHRLINSRFHLAQGPRMRSALFTFFLVVCILPSSCSFATASNRSGVTTRTKAPSSARAQSTTVHLSSGRSAGFVANSGQIIDQDGKPNDAVLYLAHQPGLNVQLRRAGFSYDSYRAIPRTAATVPLSMPSSLPVPPTDDYYFQRVDVELVNANAQATIQESAQEWHAEHYYTSGTPEQGVHNIRHCRTVRYQDIYPHIDLEFFLDVKGHVEYQFVLRPGSNPQHIQLRYHGARSVALERGRVVLELQQGRLYEHIPASFFLESSRAVSVAYRQLSAFDLGFDIPAACKEEMKRKTLVIDPTPSLNWSTYVGGDSTERAYGIGADSIGNTYITGWVNSLTNMATSGAFQTMLGSGGANDAFLTKLSPTGARLWSSYYGGNSYDWAYALRADSIGGIYLCGSTQSSNQMATLNAHQTQSGGGWIAKFNSDGTRSWSTFYGVASDFATCLCFDTSGNILIAGNAASNSTRISTTGVFQPAASTGGDCFLAKFSPLGVRIWGSYFGGTGKDEASGICTDLSGNAFICGWTASNGIATSGAHQTTRLGGGPEGADAFVMKCSADGTAKLWVSYYGGNQDDRGCAVVCDSLNNLFLYGKTTSQANIATPGTQLPTYAGGLSDNFLVKFSSTGTRIWGSYVGGTQTESCYSGLAMDPLGNVVVCGTTGGNDGIATSDSYHPNSAGGDDAFVAKYTSNGRRIWGTFYGGPGDETCTCLATDGLANILVSGYTKSTTGIATPGAYQTKKADSLFQDNFVARFWDCVIPAADIQSASNTALCLGEVTRYYVTASGDDTYQWISPRLGTIITGTNASSILVQWTKTGKDTIRMRQTTPTTGCFRDTIMIVNVYPVPLVNAGNALSLCKGNRIVLPATASGGNGTLSFAWDPVDSLSSKDSLNPVAYPMTTTRYTLSVSDTRGCIVTSAVTVTVYDKPVADAGKDVSICLGSSLNLGTAAKKNCRYMWSPSSTLDNPTLAQPRATPTATTVYTVLVTNDSTHCVDSAKIRVRIPTPSATTAPATMSFAALGACEASHDTSFVITNNGSDTLSFRTQSSTNPDFSVIESLPFSIAPGESRSVKVRFSPSAQGTSNGTISLVAKPCDYVVQYALSGKKADVALQASANLVNFGLHHSCAPSVRVDTTIQFTNKGSSSIRLTAASLTAPFSVTSPQLPQDLAPGASITLSISYQPVSYAVHNAEMRLAFQWAACNDTLRISFTAENAKAEAALPTGVVDFGSLVGCDPPRDTLIWVYNTSSVAQRLQSISGLAPNYSCSLSFPQELAARDSLALPLRYAPATNGTNTTTAHLLLEPCARDLTFELRGNKAGITVNAPDTLYLGAAPNCTDTVLQFNSRFQLSAEQNATATLQDITLNNDFSSSLKVGDTLSTQSDRLFTVSYRINAQRNPGRVIGRMIVRMQPCDMTREITLVADVQSVSTTIDNSLDFGIAAPGSAITKSVTARNTGTSAVQITTLPSVASPFAFVSSLPSIPCTLQAGDSITMQFRFNAPSAGASYSDTVSTFLAKPCAIEMKTLVFGQSFANVDTASSLIAANSIEAAQGTEVALVLRMLSSKNMQLSSAPQNFRASIVFNRDLLYLRNQMSACTQQNSAECEIVVTGTRASSTGDTLVVLPGIVTLGSTDYAPVIVKDFSWTDGSLATAVQTQDGSVRLTGGCEAGGVRLFLPGATATSLSVRPLPVGAVANIAFGLAEQSTVNMELMNASGQLVAQLLTNDTRGAGSYTLQHDLSSLANGPYFLRMRTQNYTVVCRVDVMH